MTIKIPAEGRKEWRGIFPSKYVGDFSQSWNIDLERMPGKLCLSGSSVVVLDNSDTSTLGVVRRFLTSDAYAGSDGVWALHSAGLLFSTTPQSGILWNADTHASSPAVNLDDMINFGDTGTADTALSKDRILVSTTTTIMAFNPTHAERQWDTDWWTATDTDNGKAQPALGSVYDHVFGKVQGLTVVLDGDALHSIDRNDVVSNRRIVFPFGYEGKLVYTSKDTFWIGLAPTAGGDGLILSWDGSAETYQDYKISGTPISGWIKDGVPYFINNYGQILRYDGYDFTEETHFPCYEEKLTLGGDAASEHGVWRNGCTVDGDLVYIFVAAPEYSIRMRSGVWVYNTKTQNLYHKYSVGQFKGDTGSRIDYGQPILFRRGAIFNIRYVASSTTTLIASATHYASDSATRKTAIYRFGFNDTKSSTVMRGYFVTPIIAAADVQDFWEAIWIRFRKFVSSSNKIIVKFRTADPLSSSSFLNTGLVVQQTSPVTWISDTQFRMDSPSAVPLDVKVGNEVEILSGRNAGCTFHITSITDTNGVALVPTDTTTALVNIDEDAPSGDTFKSRVRFDNWVKAGEMTDTGVAVYKFPLQGSDSDGNTLNVAEFIEFKIELRGTLMEVEQLRAVNKPTLPE